MFNASHSYLQSFANSSSSVNVCCSTLKDIKVEDLIASECPNFELGNVSSSPGSDTDLLCDFV